ncbi:hypothetical protein WJX72_006334 [[Myrmecia] bisecta]|uniref:SAM-dependent methyltransferase n=1 Tax=[Myrmecia] bisecta TaxID=41462 RepID=A0AAW1QQZ6_9CHLO
MTSAYVPDARRFAPATECNREPLLQVLAPRLPQGKGSLVLEVASGTGEHAVYLASNLPHLTWQPSDPDRASCASIASWTQHAGVAHVKAPLQLDATDPSWSVERADAVVCINMIHIAPYAACEGLFRGAASVLPPDGLLFTYGPYSIGGQHTAPSNARFDMSLKMQNPEWGVRDIDEVKQTAANNGFQLVERIDMPANNMTLVWQHG